MYEIKFSGEMIKVWDEQREIFVEEPGVILYTDGVPNPGQSRLSFLLYLYHNAKVQY